MNRWRLQKTHKSLSAKLINFAPAADGFSASEIPIATRIRLIGGGKLVQITTPPPQSGSMGQRMLRRESNLQSVSRRLCWEWKWLALNHSPCHAGCMPVTAFARRCKFCKPPRSVSSVKELLIFDCTHCQHHVAIQCCTNNCNNFLGIFFFNLDFNKCVYSLSGDDDINKS